MVQQIYDNITAIVNFNSMYSIQVSHYNALTGNQINTNIRQVGVINANKHRIYFQQWEFSYYCTL